MDNAKKKDFGICEFFILITKPIKYILTSDDTPYLDKNALIFTTCLF